MKNGEIVSVRVKKRSYAYHPSSGKMEVDAVWQEDISLTEFYAEMQKQVYESHGETAFPPRKPG